MKVHRRSLYFFALFMFLFELNAFGQFAIPESELRYRAQLKEYYDLKVETAKIEKDTARLNTILALNQFMNAISSALAPPELDGQAWHDLSNAFNAIEAAVAKFNFLQPLLDLIAFDLSVKALESDLLITPGAIQKVYEVVLKKDYPFTNMRSAPLAVANLLVSTGDPATGWEFERLDADEVDSFWNNVFFKVER